MNRYEVAEMKMAISSAGPNLKANVDPNFGRAPFLVIYDTETQDVLEVIDNHEGQDAAQGAGILVAGLLAQKGVSVIITGRVGPKAMEVIEQARMRVVANATGTVENAIMDFFGKRNLVSGHASQDERVLLRPQCRRRNVWQQSGGAMRGGRGIGGRGRGQVVGR